MKNIYGIDLGTTNSCIATIGENGLPIVIKNLDDEFTTPSVVYYDESHEIYVGKEAKSGMGGAPEQTVAFIKREMSNPNYKRQIEDITVLPVEVSAVILKKVVDDANERRSYEGLPPIHKAVITVPAYFGNMERELTRQAGEIAGLEVLDLLNEPTAAALSYGAKGLEGKTFMIYDLGGGTFDISIMHMDKGVLTTLSTDGDHKLGGVDWDIALLDFALQACGLDVTYDDIKEEREAAKMLLAAESCKKNLSKSEKASIKLIYKRKPYVKEISRSVFEEVTEDLLENTVDMIHHALKIARVPLTPSQIDEIILVGGSSYMPMVKKRLQKEFNCNIKLDILEPDRAVAQGAALHAAKLEGDSQVKVELGEDMGARSYGLEFYNSEGKMVVGNILLRTDPLIYEGTTELGTHDEGQTSVLLSLFENTSTEYETTRKKSVLLEEKEIDWGFPVPKNTSVIIHVSRNKDGILRVWGECQGKNAEFIIQPKGLLGQRDADALRESLASKRV